MLHLFQGAGLTVGKTFPIVTFMNLSVWRWFGFDTGRRDMNDFWVFGYGSLIWNPEFPVAERHIARLQGWHRSFCMWSIHRRGTVADPGEGE